MNIAISSLQSPVYSLQPYPRYTPTSKSSNSSAEGGL
jgi:hypothetical protein